MLILLAATASADQCAWISEANARAAVEHLTTGTDWLSLCEPCGDKQPTPARVGKASAAPVSSGDYWEVSIDGQGVDLAYTYIRRDGTVFANLAEVVGCPASGVSRRVTWPPGPAASDRIAPWLGTYRGPNAELRITRLDTDPHRIGVQLDAPREHGGQTATFVIQASADLDGDPVRFTTPLGPCAVRLAREPTSNAVKLTPELSCGGLLDAWSGPYKRL